MLLDFQGENKGLDKLDLSTLYAGAMSRTHDL